MCVGGGVDVVCVLNVAFELRLLKISKNLNKTKILRNICVCIYIYIYIYIYICSERVNDFCC